MLLFFAVSVKLSALDARPMEEAMQREKAMENLTDSVEQVFRLL